MVLCRVIFPRFPKKPRKTYTTACDRYRSQKGGCPKNSPDKWVAVWCLGCRRHRHEVMEARKKTP